MFIVQCDFDDTITEGGASTLIRDAFALDGWKNIDASYLRGELSVEASNKLQFALVRVGERQLLDFIEREVRVRKGFREFVDFCRRDGIRLVIASSGLDLYIEPTLRKLGLTDLEWHSGKACVTPHGIEIRYVDPWGAEIEAGFKETWLRFLKESNSPVIYIGDGRSDVAPALEADYVIARWSLEKHFKSHGLPYLPFQTFHDVASHVRELCKRAKP